MSLRLRLTLFYTLLLAGVLALAGVGQRIGLERILRGDLEQRLRDALTLARPLVATDEDNLRLSQEGELVPRLPADLALLLYRPNAQLAETLGRAPRPLPPPQTGCFSQGDWQICGEPIRGGWMLAAKPLDGLRESLSALNRVLWAVSPLAVLLALTLGYALAGRALAPVRQLTQAARERASRRLWDAPLPEPRANDELRTLSQSFNGLLATLGEVIEGERRFTQDAAHELRTPLTALLGRLEQAREKNRDPEVARVLERTQHSALGLLRLVEKLLQLARTEAGQGFAREPVALAALAQEIAEELQPLFEAKGLHLELEFVAPVLVQGDRLALGLALRNLRDNALKFTAAGGVRLGVRQEGRWGVVEVSDSGPGIPEAALPHLFERFYQARAEHRQHGSGLGLALVAAVVRWHGGQVEAANTAAGARMTLRLPLG